jgi:hypothetical protein
MTRLVRSYRALTPEQRLAALASMGLFVSMLLPWYSKADTLVVHGAAKATETSLSAFQAFSFVEAAVLLVSAAVLCTMFARGERRGFPLPGGDGVVVMIAGGWAALLIFYRLLDKPGLQGNERVTATVGVEWGIFIALLLALGLAYAGARMRALERPGPPLRRARGEPPHAPVGPLARGDQRSRADREVADLDATVVTPARVRVRASTPVPAREPGAPRERGRYPPAPPEQLSFEDPPTRSE